MKTVDLSNREAQTSCIYYADGGNSIMIQEKWHRRLLWLAIGAVVTVFITALLSPFINRIFVPLGGHSSSSASPTAISTSHSPTSIVNIDPHLNASYSGTIIDEDAQSSVLKFSSIVEKQDGEISGMMSWGGYSPSSFSGKVTHNNDIYFTVTFVVIDSWSNYGYAELVVFGGIHERLYMVTSNRNLLWIYSKGNGAKHNKFRFCLCLYVVYGWTDNAMMLLHWWPAYLEMSQQRSECLLIGGVVLPVGEVADMTVLKPCDPICIAFQNGIVQANRKEYVLAALDFLMKSGINFPFNPGTVDGMIRENEESTVLVADGFFNASQDWGTRT